MIGTISLIYIIMHCSVLMLMLMTLKVAKLGRQRAASKDRLGKEEVGKMNR